jgi:hypothetical protein
MPPQRSLAELESGAIAIVEGTVRPVSSVLLRSPLGDEECVYWEIRGALDASPERRDAIDFWLEAGGRRVLVRGDGLAASVRAERERELVEAAEADVRTVEERLRWLKEERRRAAGSRASELNRERKKLATLATLLYAIRAHARRRTHGKRSFEGQAKWIEANRHLLEAQDVATATVSVLVDRWELTIDPGQTVRVEGRFLRAPLPASLSGRGGYRQSSDGWVVEAPPDGPVRVHGIGAEAPRTPEERRRAAPPEAGDGPAVGPLALLDRWDPATVRRAQLVAGGVAIVLWVLVYLRMG